MSTIDLRPGDVVDVDSIDVDDGGEAFAHAIAHDLRSPVRTARLLADRLLADVEDQVSEVGADLGRRLEAALEQMDGMILSMLEYAALRGSDPAWEPVDVGSVVAAAASLLEADLETAGGRIETSGTATVMATPALLGRVVQNLLANALKYARPGVPPEILVTTMRCGDAAHVLVADNGVGVPAVARERVFGHMERLHPDRASGLGLGLPICRRIVEQLGGAISIEASDTPGTRVHVTLPLAPDGPEAYSSAA